MRCETLTTILSEDVILLQQCPQAGYRYEPPLSLAAAHAATYKAACLCLPPPPLAMGGAARVRATDCSTLSSGACMRTAPPFGLRSGSNTGGTPGRTAHECFAFTEVANHWYPPPSSPAATDKAACYRLPPPPFAMGGTPSARATDCSKLSSGLCTAFVSYGESETAKPPPPLLSSARTGGGTPTAPECFAFTECGKNKDHWTRPNERGLAIGCLQPGAPGSSSLEIN